MRGTTLLIWLTPLNLVALTLVQALQYAKPLSYQTMQQQQVVIQAALGYKRIISEGDYDTSLNVQLGIRENYGRSRNDSRFYLNLSKKLFDSDHQAELSFASSNIEIEKLKLNQLKLLQKIAIMRTFFDAVLADLGYNHRTQVLALAAVRARHAEEDFAFGWVSEVELLEKQAQTRLNFASRQQLESQQVFLRQQLLDLLDDNIKDRPDNLDYPKLNSYLNYQPKPEQHWHNLIATKNSNLEVLAREIKTLKTKKQHLQQSWQAKLIGFVRLGEQSYNRDKEGNYRAGVRLSVPFGDDNSEHEIEQLDILIANKKTQLTEQQEQLNAQALQLLLQLTTLKQQQQALKLEADYLQFNLDRASLEYEMRLTRNLGNSMVLVSKNELDLARVEFDIAVTIEQLNLLIL